MRADDSDGASGEFRFEIFVLASRRARNLVAVDEAQTKRMAQARYNLAFEIAFFLQGQGPRGHQPDLDIFRAFFARTETGARAMAQRTRGSR